MRADEPSWWYTAEPTLAGRLLGPVSRLWSRAAERRFAKGSHFKPDIPVICIGNFTAGGTGKTPLALLIADELLRLGVRPAFLSRGYGGRLAGPHWVAPGHDGARDVGDEPLLLAAKAPTLIARDRAAGARAIIATGANHGAIIMDDGLQNGSLAKTLTIAVVDGRRGIGNGLVMPAGPLRARMAFQIGLVDAIVINTPEGTDEMGAGFVPWLRESFAGPVMSGRTVAAGDFGWLEGANVVAFCGIGAPDRFFSLLERLGGRIVDRIAFGDHHDYSERDARRLLELARTRQAVLVTTEKDQVRLGIGVYSGDLKSRVRTLAIRLEMSERDGVRLRGLFEALFPGRRVAGT